MNLQRSSSFFNPIAGFLAVLRDFLRSDEMREAFVLKVHVAQDEDTGRWYVAESDIPGLWLEADTVPQLLERIECAASELVELNGDEILRNCVEKAVKSRTKAKPKARILPVFDSSLELAAC